jgi:hypothetical protein
MRLLRLIETKTKQFSWIASDWLTGFTDPAAAAFCENLASYGCASDLLVNVLPKRKLIYVAVPKAASTRIRMTLAMVEGRHSRTLKPDRRSRFRGPYGPRSMTKNSFFNLACSPETLRFSFVRNPYARAVSCWADKFRGKPLVPGDTFIDIYLSQRREIDAALPVGADQMLSFSSFVAFSSGLARQRCDIHIQAQKDILSLPGLDLNFVGKVESFADDFARVLDHMGVDQAIRLEATKPVNPSCHECWQRYYTDELADRIYRAYECDFDHFGYARSIDP